MDEEGFAYPPVGMMRKLGDGEKRVVPLDLHGGQYTVKEDDEASWVKEWVFAVPHDVARFEVLLFDRKIGQVEILPADESPRTSSVEERVLRFPFTDLGVDVTHLRGWYLDTTCPETSWNERGEPTSRLQAKHGQILCVEITWEAVKEREMDSRNRDATFLISGNGRIHPFLDFLPGPSETLSSEEERKKKRSWKSRETKRLAFLAPAGVESFALIHHGRDLGRGQVEEGCRTALPPQYARTPVRK